MTIGARVALDPGHGGKDPGAVANHVREADLALQYGLELASLLMGAGACVALTRTANDLPGGLSNKDAALLERCRIANDYRAQCFVSLHFNYSDDPHAHGFQVFYAKGSVNGQALARAVYRAVTIGAPDRGVYPDDSPQDGNRRLAVLRHTKMPAVLIEFGFVSNLEDVKAAQDPVKRAGVLAGVVRGIDDWLRTQHVAG